MGGQQGRETQALADTIAIGEGDPLPALKLLGKSGGFEVLTLGLPDTTAFSGAAAAATTRHHARGTSRPSVPAAWS